MTTDSIISELALFADLGTDPPRGVTAGSTLVVRMIKDGDPIELAFADLGIGSVEVTDYQGLKTNYSNFRSLLASEHFGDLRRWADTQTELLRRQIGPPEDALAPSGRLSENRRFDSIDQASELLGKSSSSGTKVVLVDGPAGIGKTHLIQLMALKRSFEYKQRRDPLILHVQSRGKVLSNLQDLMAFSLQTLRLRITYDQAPILVRHGLITLAVDGFDELGDPSGYELAWAQVNDLIHQPGSVASGWC